MALLAGRQCRGLSSADRGASLPLCHLAQVRSSSLQRFVPGFGTDGLATRSLFLNRGGYYGLWKRRSALATRHSPADYLASGVVLAPLEQMCHEDGAKKGRCLAVSAEAKEYTDE